MHDFGAAVARIPLEGVECQLLREELCCHDLDRLIVGVEVYQLRSDFVVQAHRLVYRGTLKSINCDWAS